MRLLGIRTNLLRYQLHSLMALKLLLEEKHLWFICCCLRWRLFCCVWITLFYYYLSWILVHEKHVFHWVLYLQLLLNMIRQLWSGNCLIHRKFLRRMFDPRMKNGLSLLIQLSVQVFTLLLLRWFCLFMFFVIKCRVLFVFFVKHHLLQGHLRWRNHQRCRTIFFQDISLMLLIYTNANLTGVPQLQKKLDAANCINPDKETHISLFKKAVSKQMITVASYNTQFASR